MALNIKNKEVEVLAKELASETQLSMVQVILDALRAAKLELNRQNERRKKFRRDQLDRWFDDLKKRNAQFPPVVTSQQAQSELYDELGMPQ